jgi:heptaprenyl diphosphate synthase
MVSGAPDEIKETLTVFGEKIGVAFQLVDDVIDIASESHESGKTPGTDLREGVPTLVTLNVIAMNRPEDAELIALLKEPIKDEDLVQQVIKALRAHPALELSRQQTLQYAHDARKALGPLPINDVTGALYSLCDAIIDRTS